MTQPDPAYDLLPSELPDPEQLESVVAFDTETTGLFSDDGASVAVVSIAYLYDGDMWCQAWPFDVGRAAEKGFFPVTDKKGNLKVPDDTADWDADPNLDQDEWDALYDWLEKAGQTVGLIAHNAKFDVGHIYNGTRFWTGPDLVNFIKNDTALANLELDPTEPLALKSIGARYWGAEEVAESQELQQMLALVKRRYGLKKDDGPRYDLVPWSVLGPYAAQDTVLTLRLHLLQMQRFEDGEGNRGSWQDALDLARTLTLMERRGLGPFDVKTATEWAEKIEARIKELADSLPFQPPTAYRAKEYYFDTLGLAPWQGGEDRRIRDPESGRLIKQGSLTIDVAKRMAQAGVEGAAEFAEMQRLITANRMHFRGYANLVSPEDGRIRTNFKQAFVKSGRLSVERFQAQAMPKRLGMVLNGEPVPEPRSFFLTAPGRERWNADLTQAELRIAAKLAGCDTMIDLLESGSDVHGNTCRSIFGIDPDHEDWPYKRDIAKRCNFGGIFQIGAKTFQEDLWTNAGLMLSLEECREIVYGFRNTYPEFEDQYYAWMNHAERHGFVTLASGSRSFLHPVRDYPRTGWSRVVQGSLAEWVRSWLIDVERITGEHDALVLTVHDSIVLDLPSEHAERLKAEISEMTAESWYKAFGISGGADWSPWIK